MSFATYVPPEHETHFTEQDKSLSNHNQNSHQKPSGLTFRSQLLYPTELRVRRR